MHGGSAHGDGAAVQGKVSPAWESISAPRHLFLMLTTLSHSVTAYEVSMLLKRHACALTYMPPGTCITQSVLLQLPIYVPSEAEKTDPSLYARNVREYMVRMSLQHAQPAAVVSVAECRMLCLCSSGTLA